MLRKVIFAAVIAFVGMSPARATYIDYSPNLPPINGQYTSAPGVLWHYSKGGPGQWYLRDVHLGGFTNSTFNYDGVDTTWTFNLTGGASSNQGAMDPSWWTPVALSGPASFKLYGYSRGQLGMFQAEVLSLNLAGAWAPITLNPTYRSLGQMTFAALGNGLFQIDSSIVLYTQFAFDPSTVEPANPVTVELSNLPLPAAGWLFIAGFGFMGTLRRAVRRAPQRVA